MLLTLQVVAVVVTAVSWLPQWWRVLRSRSDGLSRAAWAQAAMLGGTWAIWGLQEQVWSLALSEGAFAVGALAILATVLPGGRFAVYALVALAAAAAAAVWVPATWLAVGGLAGSTAMRLSQVVAMVRSRSSDGVATTAWVLLCLSGTAWGAVGLATGEWPLVVGAVLGIVSTALLAAVARRFASSRSSMPPSPAVQTGASSRSGR
jgi:uncharacterized protein with PQ loop repeat